MRLFVNTRYNFMALGRPALAFSAFMMVGSIILIFTKGLNLGVDFTGGVKIDVLVNRKVTLADLEKIRSRAAVEIHSVGRNENELLIQQKGLERAGEYAAAVVKGRKKRGGFKSLAEVAALPKMDLTERELGAVFSVGGVGEGKGGTRIDINKASPETIRERFQQIIVDKTVANLRGILGETFGRPEPGKINLNELDDVEVLKATLARKLPPGDAAAIAANVARRRSLGGGARTTTLLVSLDEALAGAKVSAAGARALRENFYASAFVIRGTENIGPRVSRDLVGLAIKALAFALLVMLVYIAIRFRINSGVVAIISLIHDVVITMGFVSLFGFEVDLTAVAAFLTVVGYSINDTVVTYDRIREDMRQGRKETYAEMLNRAINENLSRTLITGMGTLIALTTLFFLGGQPLRSFSFILWMGVVLGTYSSVYICATLLNEINSFVVRRRRAGVEAKVAKAQITRKKKKR